jgi:hypothetical protein
MEEPQFAGQEKVVIHPVPEEWFRTNGAAKMVNVCFLLGRDFMNCTRIFGIKSFHLRKGLEHQHSTHEVALRKSIRTMTI